MKHLERDEGPYLWSKYSKCSVVFIKEAVLLICVGVIFWDEKLN